MKDSFFTLRGFLILSLMLLSAESFAQRLRRATPQERQAMIEEGVDGAYDENTQDGGLGMPCDDPRTIGEANRSPEENACWESYARGFEEADRRRSEETQEAIRRHNESMRRSEREGRNGNRGFGRDFYDW
jgi:hypothetical protein